MKTGNIITSALIGMTFGAVAAILLAPASGKETRRRIRKKGEELSNQMKESMNEYLTNAKDTFDEAKSMTTDAIHTGKENYNEIKKEINALLA